VGVGEDGPDYSCLRGWGIVQDREYYWDLRESVLEFNVQYDYIQL